jgi:hypothetical protein
MSTPLFVDGSLVKTGCLNPSRKKCGRPVPKEKVDFFKLPPAVARLTQPWAM